MGRLQMSHPKFLRGVPPPSDLVSARLFGTCRVAETGIAGWWFCTCDLLGA